MQDNTKSLLELYLAIVGFAEKCYVSSKLFGIGNTCIGYTVSLNISVGATQNNGKMMVNGISRQDLYQNYKNIKNGSIKTGRKLFRLILVNC